MKDSPSPPPKNRRLRRLGYIPSFLVFAWLGSGVFANWYSTTRHTPPRKAKAWVIAHASTQMAQLQTQDGETLEAILSVPEKPKLAVLLLHGQGGSCSQWRLLTEHLIKRNFAVCAITFRGHGGSSGERFDFGFDESQDVIAAVSYVSERFPELPRVVVGQSLGSIAALIASPQIDIDGLLLESPYRDLETALSNRLNIYLPNLLSQVAIQSMKISASLFLKKPLDSYAPRDYASKIPNQVPVVWLGGSNDLRAPAVDIREMAATCRSTRSMIIIENADHRSIQTTEPSTYRHALDELCDSVIRLP